MAVAVITLTAAGCDSPATTTADPVSPTPLIEEVQNTSDLLNEVPETEAAPKVTPLIPQPIVETPKKVETTKSNCDPNYSGCVPIASDVDCSGGSGNGPAYTGRVTVIGTDIYDLDRDGDGVACE